MRNTSAHITSIRSTSARHGFTLVELLVVIGIIAVLIGILLPTLTRARASGNAVKCASNMRQVGVSLRLYSELWKGTVFPPALGNNVLPHNRWPVQVFKQNYPTKLTTSLDQDSTLWRPDLLLCPADSDPASQVSYVLNDLLADRKVKYSTRIAPGVSPSDVVIASEKNGNDPAYYTRPVGTGTNGWSSVFESTVDDKRHGKKARTSNYLHLDGSVTALRTNDATSRLNPWDTFASNSTTRPSTTQPSNPTGTSTTRPSN